MQPQRPEDYHAWSTYVRAREEARVLGERRVGTEHLAVALLAEPEVAAALQVDPAAAREKLLELDRSALADIGVEVPLPEPQVPSLEDLPARPSLREVLHRRLPLTPVAKSVLSSTGREMRRGRRHRGPAYVMAALLELPRSDPAAELFKALGVETSSARERLRTDG